MVNLAAIFASLILIGLSLFQLALLLGKPYGEFAWGGQKKVLSRNLRIASGVSIVLYLVMMRILLGAAGLIPECMIQFVAEHGAWIATILFFVGILLNLFSKSKKERNLMTPLSILLFICSLIVALNQ